MASNSSGAIILAATNWHDLCVRFLVRNSRSGTGAMLQSLWSTRIIGYFHSSG